MPRIKFTPFEETQTLKRVDRHTELNEQHVRISRSMIYSKAFLSLNAVALRLYIILRLKFHNEEHEKRDFAFSKSLGVKVLGLSEKSEASIRRGLKELIKKGFIEYSYISKGGGKKTKIPNRFRFSNNWKKYNPNQN